MKKPTKKQSKQYTEGNSNDGTSSASVGRLDTSQFAIPQGPDYDWPDHQQNSGQPVKSARPPKKNVNKLAKNK